MRHTLILTLVLLSFLSNGQDFKNQRMKFAVMNVGFNAFMGGVGSCINKKSNKTFAYAFGNGFLKGALGGTVTHFGMSLTHQIVKQKNISYGWPAKIINSLGASMVQNASENNKLFEQINLNLFIARLEYFPYTNKVTSRLFPSSIYGIIVTGKNARLDVLKSLKSGVFYFESNSVFKSNLVQGAATAQVSSIGMSERYIGAGYYEVFAHEYAHILQYDRLVWGNAVIKPIDGKLKASSDLYKSMSKYIYFDLNGPIFYFAYKFQNPAHSCNYFEQEAENYSNRRYYGCN